jgi:phosphoadenosine phosphosulfate reductase
MIDTKKQNQLFEKATPEEVLAWGWKRFAPDAALLSSFGTESVVLLHMVSEVARDMPVFFLETGYHFKETLEYKKALIELLNLNVIDLKSEMSREEFISRFGEDLYRWDPDSCCEINKVAPLQKALVGLRAWISGIRRAQGPERKQVGVLEEYPGRPYKLNPLANWTSKETWAYIQKHSLPTHPLYDKGYTSIGCWPCTRPPMKGEDDRAGRWANRVKTECGIHTFMKPKK